MKTTTTAVSGLFLLLSTGACRANETQRGEPMEKTRTNLRCGNPVDEAKLKGSLTTQQFQVACQNSTEAAFRNEYWDNHKDGLYLDIVSKVPLFSSKDKFDSGTGWPSFTKPISEKAVLTKSDSSQGMPRVEVRGAASNAHLGHVFSDGPAPTGLRFCMNSASLKFVPVEELSQAGYGEFLKLFPEQMKKLGSNLKTATFAAGCFWGVEAYFDDVKGVIDTKVGYTGGRTDGPNYEEVSSGTTNHAESIEILYDPKVVSYERLLKNFFKLHDPTSLNRQGNDRGTQYRSAIFYHDEEQKAAAEKMIRELHESGKVKGKIVTQVVSASTFYPAEEYHQKYLAKHPGGYCHVDLKHIDQVD